MTDQTAAPRAVPTFADRTAADAPLPTWLPDALDELRAERVKTGRLEGDLRSQTRVVAELTAEREHMELNPTGTAEWLKNRVNELTAERDAEWACDQHPAGRAKTMRHMHRADQCPGKPA